MLSRFVALSVSLIRKASLLQNYMKDEFYAMADQFGVMIHNGRS